MLQTLHIRDLALIESAEIGFHEGLNVISGETGGGKTLVVAALKLLRGERGSSGLIRHEASELRVDGEFLLERGKRSQAIRQLAQEVTGVEPEEETLLITRLLDRKGRSKVRIQGQPATLGALRQLGPYLLEIHGQGDSRGLMRPGIQCETLDSFARCENLREDFAGALAEARDAQARLREATGSQRERLGRIEYLRYQLAAMQELALERGEVADLEAEHQVLSNLDHLRELLRESLGSLQEEDRSAVERLGQAARCLREAVAIDPPLAEGLELLEEALIQAAEAARLVQSRREDLDLDPRRLQHVEERLTALRQALRRYGPTEEEYLQAQEEAGGELASLTAGVQDPEELRAALDRCLERACELGRRLVRARRKAVPSFTRNVEAELQDLGMPHTRLQVALEEKVSPAQLLEQATSHGPGPLDLLVRINPGEPFHPLRETASGGELARVVIAIKRCLADRDRVPFLVLDEVDAEIGGRLGLAVGQKLLEVSRNHQVLIVTHLPQVAAFASAHLQVAKEVVGGRTRTTIRSLEGEAAEEELAAMAVGEGADAEAIEEARRLVARARSRTG